MCLVRLFFLFVMFFKEFIICDRLLVMVEVMYRVIMIRIIVIIIVILMFIFRVLFVKEIEFEMLDVNNLWFLLWKSCNFCLIIFWCLVILEVCLFSFEKLIFLEIMF